MTTIIKLWSDSCDNLLFGDLVILWLSVIFQFNAASCLFSNTFLFEMYNYISPDNYQIVFNFMTWPIFFFWILRSDNKLRLHWSAAAAYCLCSSQSGAAAVSGKPLSSTSSMSDSLSETTLKPLPVKGEVYLFTLKAPQHFKDKKYYQKHKAVCTVCASMCCLWISEKR